MHQLSFCFLIALLTPADGIFCYNCTNSGDYNCSLADQECTSTVNSCITIARDENTEGQDIENPAYEKRCNNDDRLCNQFYELKAGAFHMRWNSSCCRADRCNNKRVIVQNASQVLNGVRCNSCFARGTDVCLNTTRVNCTGNLNQCIHFVTVATKEEYRDQQVVFTGCATKNMCSMGAAALFAADRHVSVKTVTCSGAPGVPPAPHSLALFALAGLFFLVYRS